MIARRDLEKVLKRYVQFPVVAILGPRQSGKTTLSQNYFKKHRYISLEDPEARTFVTQDPKRFLREYENDHGIIIDEFQYVPEILSYIQIESDAFDRPGYFILTGSQNFLMNQAITQSLAGRVGILHLLPLSIHELDANALLSVHIDTLLFKGGYPRIQAKKMAPRDLFPSYIRTYVERDVRQLINVDNIRTFQKFMKLCAGRVGQLLNIADLAMNCGISQKTANQWLSILEASYIIFLLKPYFKNFSKRVTKSPKLYFYDTGLACSLLELRTSKEVAVSTFRGALFENLIIADLYKQYFNLGFEPALYFWRDKNGRIEIDGLIDAGIRLIPLEIKSGETLVKEFFDPLVKWSALTDTNPEDGYLIYGGTRSQKRSVGHVLSWKKAGTLIDRIEKERM